MEMCEVFLIIIIIIIIIILLIVFLYISPYAFLHF